MMPAAFVSSYVNRNWVRILTDSMDTVFSQYLFVTL